MITISLDEAGRFEKTSEVRKSDSKTTLIGGILFDDADVQGEFENEQKRIEAFYNAVMEKAKSEKPNMQFSYPEDLHSRNGKNNDKVKVVKTIVNKALAEYLRKGTFEGCELQYDGEELPPRNGSFNICAIVKSKNGKSNLLNSHLGKFFNDEAASNLYYHMASEAVEHFIFHNPIFLNIEKLNLDIATRQSGLLNEEDAKVYDEIGVSENVRIDLDEGVKQYSLMNADVFRTILTEQMLEERENKIVVESCRVRPISYYKNKKNKDQVFLYLADSICSILTFEIKADDVYEVKNRAQKLLNKKSLVFAYDEVDLYFKRAWQDMEVGEYYDALHEIYKISAMDTDEAKLYSEYWCSYIKNQIIDKSREDIAKGKEPRELMEALQELRSTIMSNRYNQNEAEFIFRVFRSAVIKTEETNRFFRMLYAVNEIGLAINSHGGKLSAAEMYFENCEKYAGASDIEEYVRIRNRYTNALMDSFDYERAFSILKVTIELIFAVYEASVKIFGHEAKVHFGGIELAKTYSQLGQICAFLQDEEALEYFDWAIKHMNNDLHNMKITLSYKLHYLIERGDKEAYKENMIEYHEGFYTIENQIKIISMMEERGDINRDYAYYVFLKGLHTFYSDEEISGVWNEVKKLEASINDMAKSSHPWEIIYKYLSLLAYRMNEAEIAKEYRGKILSSVGDVKGSIISAIALFGEAQVIEATGDNALAGNKYTSLYNRLEEEFEFFNPERLSHAKSKDKKEFMKSRFTYMYN